MWGTHWRQRLRLAPLYVAIAVADALALVLPQSLRGRGARAVATLPAGISVVIPERDAPDLLRRALASVSASLAATAEPGEVIVVVNGAPLTRYDALAGEYPHVVWIHDDDPLGFSAAITRGLERVQYDATFLMNNDMTVDEDTLRVLAANRAADVFAVAAQIFQQSADGRREETGFVDWYEDEGGIRVYHADPGVGSGVREHLCASGGAALFRTARLAQYVHDGRAFDPFYWEDVDWGTCAWEDGMRVLFCPQAHAWHRHRSTTARFHSAPELARIVERNRMLYAVRHPVACPRAGLLLQWICGLPYDDQRHFARIGTAASLFAHRFRAARTHCLREPPRLARRDSTAVALAPQSFSYRLRAHDPGPAPRPRLLLVSPFAVFPPQHGGARRIGGLIKALRDRYDVILLSDEASLYNARSFAYFEGLHAVHLVQRRERAQAPDTQSLELRMQAHVHPEIVRSLEVALQRHAPDIVQIEHVELARLVAARRAGQHWVLGLHDAYGSADFAVRDEAERFTRDTLARYDALTFCSPEDGVLLGHPWTVCVRNGTDLDFADYRPSTSLRMLFMGPFRYGPNLDGIRAFLAQAFPGIRAAVPGVSLCILGGQGARARIGNDPLFAQAGVELHAHRDDIAALLANCAFTVNPLSGIRGSAIKLIESLKSGRICVSTAQGARGFHDVPLPGLVIRPSIEAMIEPCVELLQDAERRHQLEAPDDAVLDRFGWDQCARPLAALYAQLLAAA